MELSLYKITIFYIIHISYLYLGFGMVCLGLQRMLCASYVPHFFCIRYVLRLLKAFTFTPISNRASWWVVISAYSFIIRGCPVATWSNEGRDRALRPLWLHQWAIVQVATGASRTAQTTNCWLVFCQFAQTYFLETVSMVMMKVIEMMELPLAWCWVSWIEMIVRIQVFAACCNAHVRPTADWGAWAHPCQKPWWPCLSFERLKSFPGALGAEKWITLDLRNELPDSRHIHLSNCC